MSYRKTYSIDRFEGAYAVLVDNSGKSFDVLRDNIPEDVKDGDILIESGSSTYTYDEEKTRAAREKIQRLMDALEKK